MTPALVSELRIAQATPDDAHHAAHLLREAATWLVEIGQKNWEPEWFSPDCFVENAERGELWLAWHGDKAVGTMQLHSTDTDFWPEDPPGAALYLHKLAVARHVAGQGIAQALLQFAEEHTRASGFPILRLDCRSDRPKLRAVYESAGYTLVDEVIVFGWFSAARYEKSLIGAEE